MTKLTNEQKIALRRSLETYHRLSQGLKAALEAVGSAHDHAVDELKLLFADNIKEVSVADYSIILKDGTVIKLPKVK